MVDYHTNSAALASELEAIDAEIAIFENLSEVAEGISQLNDIVKILTAADPEDQAGQLLGDASVKQTLGQLKNALGHLSETWEGMYGKVTEPSGTIDNVNSVVTLLDQLTQTVHATAEKSGPDQLRALADLLSAVKDGIGVVDAIKLNPVIGAMLTGYLTAIDTAATMLHEIAEGRRELHEAIDVAGGAQPQAERDHVARQRKWEALEREWLELRRRHDARTAALQAQRWETISRLNATTTRVVKAHCALRHRALIKEVLELTMPTGMGWARPDVIDQRAVDSILGEWMGAMDERIGSLMAEASLEGPGAADATGEARRLSDIRAAVREKMGPVVDCLRRNYERYLRSYAEPEKPIQPVLMMGGGGGLAGFATIGAIIHPDWVNKWRQGPCSYTPEDHEFLREIYAGAQEAGVNAAGISRIAELGPSVTGLGGTATIVLRVNAEGRIIPGWGASSEPATSLLHVWVGPSTVPSPGGEGAVERNWVAFARQIDTRTGRQMAGTRSGPSTGETEAAQGGRAWHEYGDDPAYQEWYAENTAHSPGEAVEQALGRIVVGPNQLARGELPPTAPASTGPPPSAPQGAPGVEIEPLAAAPAAAGTGGGTAGGEFWVNITLPNGNVITVDGGTGDIGGDLDLEWHFSTRTGSTDDPHQWDDDQAAAWFAAHVESTREWDEVDALARRLLDGEVLSRPDSPREQRLHELARFRARHSGNNYPWPIGPLDPYLRFEWLSCDQQEEFIGLWTGLLAGTSPEGAISAAVGAGHAVEQAGNRTRNRVLAGVALAIALLIGGAFALSRNGDDGTTEPATAGATTSAPAASDPPSSEPPTTDAPATAACTPLDDHDMTVSSPDAPGGVMESNWFRTTLRERGWPSPRFEWRGVPEEATELAIVVTTITPDRVAEVTADPDADFRVGSPLFIATGIDPSSSSLDSALGTSPLEGATRRVHGAASVQLDNGQTVGDVYIGLDSPGVMLFTLLAMCDPPERFWAPAATPWMGGTIAHDSFVVSMG